MNRTEWFNLALKDLKELDNWDDVYGWDVWAYQTRLDLPLQAAIDMYEHVQKTYQPGVQI